jgi:hypothetical protein
MMILSLSMGFLSLPTPVFESSALTEGFRPHPSESEFAGDPETVASHKAIIVFDAFIGLPLAGDAAATAIPGRRSNFSYAFWRMLRSSTLRLGLSDKTGGGTNLKVLDLFIRK